MKAVDRSWHYTQPDIRAETERLRSLGRRALPPTTPARQRGTEASLTRRLEVALARNRDLTNDNQRLRRQLAQALGQLRAVGPPVTDEVAALKASVIRAPARPASARPADTCIDRNRPVRRPNLRVGPGTCSAKVMRSQDSSSRTNLNPDDRVDHLDRFPQHALDRGKQQLAQLRQHFVHGEGLSTTPPSGQAIAGRTSVVVGGQCVLGRLAAHEPGSTHQTPLESTNQGTGRRSTGGPPRSVRRAAPRAAAGC